MCANELVMFNRMIGVKFQFLKHFVCKEKWAPARLKMLSTEYLKKQKIARKKQLPTPTTPTTPMT